MGNRSLPIVQSTFVEPAGNGIDKMVNVYNVAMA